MDDVLMQQGIDLMLYGMGTVFAFLTLLVVATVLMSTIVRRLFPDPADVPPETSVDTPRAPVEPRILAAIKAALEQHRKG